jgi:5-methylcytosine-specific restriction endonuclease McrA
MGWSYEPIPGWSAISRRILRRDGHRCYVCRGEAKQVDHVVPVAAGGTHHDSNLAAICSPCHAEKTARERAEGIERMPRRRRQPEQHPGLR